MDIMDIGIITVITPTGTPRTIRISLRVMAVNGSGLRLEFLQLRLMARMAIATKCGTGIPRPR